MFVIKKYESWVDFKHICYKRKNQSVCRMKLNQNLQKDQQCQQFVEYQGPDMFNSMPLYTKKCV